MQKEKVSEIIGLIDEKYIEEAALFSDGSRQAAEEQAALPQDDKTAALKRKGRSSRRFRFGLAAACLAAVLLLGTGAFALRAEAKEYQAAVQFFEENGLSTEGLSRTEVKAVYRDITTKSFTYGKTAEVIRQAVPGWEIAQEEVTPEELSKWWERKDLTVVDNPDALDPAEDPRLGSGMRYLVDHKYRSNSGTDTSFEKSIVRCYRDRELLWTAEFTNFEVHAAAYYEEGTVVWGQKFGYYAAATPMAAWAACIDGNGTVLWQHRLNHGFTNYEMIGTVLPNDDGGWAVISRGDGDYLCLTKLDKTGRETYFHQTDVGNQGLWGAARLGDGYLVHLGSYNTGDYAHLYRMDREGNLTDDFSYEGDDCVYHITGMAEFGGQVYLSAYAVPAAEQPRYGREEIGNILEALWARDDHGFDITSEELTPLMRENYTAVLLICDAESGTAKTFYSVQGSIGDALNVNEEGKLEWNVKRIDSAFFSPATSAFSIGCTCRVFRYTFDESGSLTGQTDTGEAANYYK